MKNTQTHTLTSKELQLKEVLHHFLEYKAFKQKIFYFGSGAKQYYQIVDAHRQGKKQHDRLTLLEEEYYTFLKNHYLDKKADGTRLAIVSLGVGNAVAEKTIMERLRADGYDATLFAIDSSPEMIELAQASFGGTDLAVEYYCADFSSEDSIAKLNEALAAFDMRAFLFLGGTVGNVEQDYMADLLYDMLAKGDMLLLDVSTRASLSHVDDRQLFERYLGYLDEPLLTEFFFQPLKDLGVSQEDGEFFLKMQQEPALGALQFLFSFRFFDKTVLNRDGRTITFLPDSTVSLITIRAYDPEGLKRFYEERNFTAVGEYLRTEVGIFLFEKQ